MIDRIEKPRETFLDLNRRALREIKDQIAEQKQRTPGKYDRQLLVLKLTSPLYPDLQRGYHFGRSLDDIADGDVPIPGGFSSFPEYANFLQARLDRLDDPTTTTGRTEILMVAVMPGLIQKEKHPGEAKKGAIRFINVMEAESLRREKQLVLTKDELGELNMESFGASANMAFLAIGSSVRSKQIPELALSQAKAYALRDLKQETKRGISNIPLETLQEAGLAFPDLVANPGLIDESTVLQHWIEAERQEALSLVKDLKERSMDWKARRLTQFLASKVNKICTTNFERT